MLDLVTTGRPFFRSLSRETFPGGASSSTRMRNFRAVAPFLSGFRTVFLAAASCNSKKSPRSSFLLSPLRTKAIWCPFSGSGVWGWRWLMLLPVGFLAAVANLLRVSSPIFGLSYVRFLTLASAQIPLSTFFFFPRLGSPRSDRRRRTLRLPLSVILFSSRCLRDRFSQAAGLRRLASVDSYRADRLQPELSGCNSHRNDSCAPVSEPFPFSDASTRASLDPSDPDTFFRPPSEFFFFFFFFSFFFCFRISVLTRPQDRRDVPNSDRLQISPSLAVEYPMLLSGAYVSRHPPFFSRRFSSCSGVARARPPTE